MIEWRHIGDVSPQPGQWVVVCRFVEDGLLPEVAWYDGEGFFADHDCRYEYDSDWWYPIPLPPSEYDGCDMAGATVKTNLGLACGVVWRVNLP